MAWSLPGLLRDYADAGPRRALAHRLEEALPHVQAPTLVVRGERDPIVAQPLELEALEHLLQARGGRGPLVRWEEAPGGPALH